MTEDIKQKVDKEQLRKDISDVVEKAVKRNLATISRNKYFDLLRILLLPLVIAIISVWATLHISENELNNARYIGEKQIESARLVAKADRDHSYAIANSTQATERLGQIKDIFRNLIESGSSDANRTISKANIASLEIYGNLALDYLINIREFYKGSKNCEQLTEQSESSILNILKKSQPDFSHIDFVGDAKNVINLRFGSFENYNLSHSKFICANLFSADFRRCSLMNSTFENVDLHGANFSGSNLKGAKFLSTGDDPNLKTNLRKADFRRAKLEAASFSDCQNLSDALFSLADLLLLDQPPFSHVMRTDYINLLVPHKDNLILLNSQNPQGLEALLKKTEYEFDELIERLVQKEANGLHLQKQTHVPK